MVLTRVVSVTKKGQATIPKELREKFGLKRKILVVETEEGVLFKPLLNPEEDFGSLKGLFQGKTSKEILREARVREQKREKRLRERFKK